MGYKMEECMNFCSRYIKGIETKESRQQRNDYGDDNASQPLGKKTRRFLDRTSLEQAHKWILGNNDATASFRE